MVATKLATASPNLSVPSSPQAIALMVEQLAAKNQEGNWKSARQVLHQARSNLSRLYNDHVREKLESARRAVGDQEKLKQEIRLRTIEKIIHAWESMSQSLLGQMKDSHESEQRIAMRVRSILASEDAAAGTLVNKQDLSLSQANSENGAVAGAAQAVARQIAQSHQDFQMQNILQKNRTQSAFATQCNALQKQLSALKKLGILKKIVKYTSKLVQAATQAALTVATAGMDLAAKPFTAMALKMAADSVSGGINAGIGLVTVGDQGKKLSQAQQDEAGAALMQQMAQSRAAQNHGDHQREDVIQKRLLGVLGAAEKD